MPEMHESDNKTDASNERDDKTALASTQFLVEIVNSKSITKLKYVLAETTTTTRHYTATTLAAAAAECIVSRDSQKCGDVWLRVWKSAKRV